MKRREFLKTASAGALGAAALALVGCGAKETAAPAEETAAGQAGELSKEVAKDKALPELKWQMATSWPVALDTIYGGAETFANRVTAMTGGKFTITARAAGELAPGLQVLDVVSQGAVPVGHTASYYYVGKTNAVAFGTTLPFGLLASQQNSWLYEGGGLQLMQDLYKERFNVIQFPAGNTGAQMGGWFNKEINTPKDLEGIKMRIPGLGGKVMNKLGVTVQVLPGGEIFQALQTNAIDAAEWVGPYDDEKLGFHKVAKYYYFPGWWEPGPTLEVQVNLDEWNKLPEVYQEIIKSAAYEANMTMLARYNAKNNEALQRLIDYGIELRRYSDEVLNAAESAANELYDEFKQQDADFKSIFEQWDSFRQRIWEWNSINEASFMEYISGKFPSIG
jgi:TRAP-type mannitol/chloroaromatic compound transport system substrate-binding protein